MPFRFHILTLVSALLSVSSTPIFATPIQWTTGSGGNGHYYDVVHAPAGISWSAANSAATSAGGYLATITSAAEGAFVYTSLVDNPIYWNQEPSGSDLGPWLGAYQTSDNGGQASQNWVWVTGEPWSYTSWHSGEPNNFTGSQENYLSYKCSPTPNCRTSNWNDLPDNISVYGTSVLAYVIEWNAPTSIQTPTISAAQLRAFPNPFSQSTRVSVTVPEDEAAELTIYDTAGTAVRHVVTAAGREHRVEWDGRDDRGARLASGVYFMRAKTRSSVIVGRVVLIR
jgi:hypothetical protein